MLNAKIPTRFFIVSFALVALIMTGCQPSAQPTIPQVAGSITPSDTIAPTLQAPTTSPISPDKLALIVQSSIREDTQVIFFNDKLWPIQSFASHMANPFLSADRCQLNSLSYIDNQISIKAFDFEGKMIDSVSVALAEAGTHFVHALTMSPDGSWIAYKETSGDYGRSYADGEIQDVKIVRVISGEAQTPMRVSERSGAKWSNLSWSPDGKGLLYTDFDQNNRHQIFLFNPETGSRTQMTNLEIDYSFLDLEWSRDSKYFAFFFFDNSAYESGKSAVNGRIGLVSGANLATLIIAPGYSDVIEAQIIWSNDNKLLILAQRQGNQPSLLLWYDLPSQSIIRSVESTTFDPEWKIYYAFPLNYDLTSIGLLGRSVYIYDMPGGSYTTLDDAEITDWLLLGELHVLRDTTGSYKPVKCGSEK